MVFLVKNSVICYNYSGLNIILVGGLIFKMKQIKVVEIK